MENKSQVCPGQEKNLRIGFSSEDNGFLRAGMTMCYESGLQISTLRECLELTDANKNSASGMELNETDEFPQRKPRFPTARTLLPMSQ